ncbi:unnamed protein product [Porites lobata]|uniref:Uncharacterized protein n=1 Tax=Porites lobata TaxID=104759 RepID=A0ABN8RTG5_9CNID|nr:unnamed protein product [Porites lobata]
MFEKHSQEAKQKAFIQHQRHTRKCDEGFEMCDDEKDDVLSQAYYKYAREDGHHPESYRVLKVLYERHIEGKHGLAGLQIAHLIKMVQFRRGSKFTVLPTDGINSDQWRREDPANREPS